LDARAPSLLVERALLRRARSSRGDAPGRASVQTRDLLAQPPQTDQLVPVLAALLAACDDDSGRQVTKPHSRLHLVDVLAARPARAECVELALAQQLLVRVRYHYQVFRGCHSKDEWFYTTPGVVPETRRERRAARHRNFYLATATPR